jgi:translin
MSLKKILKKIDEELKKRESIKDELYDAMRKTTRLSKQAIFMVHKDQLEDGKKLLKEAKKLFGKLAEIPSMNSELIYSGIVSAAFQEFAEANILLSLIENEKFVNPLQIEVPSTSYMLGLADVVGELRRKVLTSLRDGDVETSEKHLKTMELIFNELMAMDVGFRVSEMRRKSDIARRIIEITRGDVVTEIRRTSLQNSITKLERSLKPEK